ncbi:MAG: type I restriction enzyme endonuclease domain-containing protein, partial [Bacteroidaceae bacterium]
NERFNSVSKDGKNTKKVSFKTYFLQNVKRMRKAYDLCQPSGELGEEESALAQCFMAIAGMVYKMNGTDAPDTNSMNRRVAKMVEEALKYNHVESIMGEGEVTDIFGPEFTERLEDIKMPATKLELLIKMLRKQITEYGRTNGVASKKFDEMLEATIQEYHERRKFLSEQEAGATQEATAESIINNATQQALNILRVMKADRESFRKLGLTFEEKAFYDILIHIKDKNNFEYGEDKEADGIVVNNKCKSLAREIKEIIDEKSSFADWLNNQRVRDRLKQDIKIKLVKNGYPPQYTPEVFREVMEQVENFKENEGMNERDVKTTSAQPIYMYSEFEEESERAIAAEEFECYKWNQFNQNIIDFFGGEKTILVGCVKNKKQKDWILSHNIYNVRLGKTKGSMEKHIEMFGKTSLLVLYEFGKHDKLSAYSITGHKEMSKEDLIAMDYPNKNPRKSYMTFSIEPLNIDLSLLVNHRLIEKLIEINADNEKGTPIFIEP